ncbi:hypothetical protein WN48_01559 [Eufriesea mexicana]|nr:hypothetical protein WN48_01559 [Eufriesea mexicana]
MRCGEAWLRCFFRKKGTNQTRCEVVARQPATGCCSKARKLEPVGLARRKLPTQPPKPSSHVGLPMPLNFFGVSPRKMLLRAPYTRASNLHCHSTDVHKQFLLRSSFNPFTFCRLSHNFGAGLTWSRYAPGHAISSFENLSGILRRKKEFRDNGAWHGIEILLFVQSRGYGARDEVGEAAKKEDTEEERALTAFYPPPRSDFKSIVNTDEVIPEANGDLRCGECAPARREWLSGGP